MPLRLLQYTGNVYEKLITLKLQNKYGRKLIPLPVPKLVVFYNGEQKEPDEQILQLSNAFPDEKKAESDIEVRVRMITINKGRSPKMIEACRPLREYTWTVETIRAYEKQMELSDAIDRTLDEMPKDFEIKPYLDANRVEVKKMLLTEYNEAETMRMFKEEGREEGLEEGLVKGALRTLAGLVKDGILSLSDAAKRVGMSEKDFQKEAGLSI